MLLQLINLMYSLFLHFLTSLLTSSTTIVKQNNKGKKKDKNTNFITRKK